jgi:hypothetical protein
MTWFDVLIEFPNLLKESCSEASKTDPFYNCIAFAASDTTRIWCPISPKAYWPTSAPRVLTLEAFKAAFATLGFEECDGGELDQGFEKIAIYALRGKPKHAAKQLPDGRWASKLGREQDIEHQTVNGVSGDHYGEVAVYLKRRIQSPD